DKIIGEFLQFLDTEVGKDRYVVVISADHGVCPMPEHPATKPKYPSAKRVEFREVFGGLDEALDTAFWKQGDVKMKWFEAFTDGLLPWIYLDHKAIEARKLKVDDVAAFVRDWVAGRGDIDTAFTRKELEDHSGLDKPFKQAAMLAYHPDRCG